jgi:hypothetical protein
MAFVAGAGGVLNGHVDGAEVVIAAEPDRNLCDAAHVNRNPSPSSLQKR